MCNKCISQSVFSESFQSQAPLCMSFHFSVTETASSIQITVSFKAILLCIVKIKLFNSSVKKMDVGIFLVSPNTVLVFKRHKKDLIHFSCFLPVNVPSTVMEAMSRQDTLQPFNKSSKLSPATPQRSIVFPQTPCSRNFSLLDKSGSIESGFNQISVKNQRVLASPTSTSQLNSEFSDWHLWKCGQCFKTFTQRILLQMHVCTQNPDR